MSRTLNKLSARFVMTATEVGRHSDGGGLYLSISPNGGRRWVFLYRWRGKPTEMGLGPARDVSLARARGRAAEARSLLAERRSPLEARRAEQAVPTFGEAADALIEALAPSWRNEKHAEQWSFTLGRRRNEKGELANEGYCLGLGNLTVDSIGTEDVLRELRPLWQEKPETGARVRSRIEAVLDAAKAHGHRTAENPARLKGHLDKLLGPRRKLSRGHHAAMPYTKLPAFVARLRAFATISNLALEFTILTASRTGETIGAGWSEIDLRERLWTVPGERMKGGRPHVVPLTDRTVAILEALLAQRQSGQELVFAGRTPERPLSSMALTMALRRAGAGDVTVHGFRSAFRDWCGDKTTHPREVAEAALAHAVRDQTEAAYRRATALEKRRALMESWERFLTSGDGTNVVPIRHLAS